MSAKAEPRPTIGLNRSDAAFFCAAPATKPAAVRAGIPEELRGLRVGLAFLNLADLLLEVAIGGEQIQPAIEIVVEEEHAELQEAAGWPGRRLREIASSVKVSGCGSATT